MPVKFPVKYPIRHLRSVFSQKKFGEKDLFGTLDFGSRLYGGLFDASGIYRVRHYNGKVYREVMDFYPYKIRHSIPLDANRDKFRNAVLAWQALVPAEKIAYNLRATGRHYFGYHLFMKEYLKA